MGGSRAIYLVQRPIPQLLGVRTGQKRQLARKSQL